jgi:hypothetical protein
MKNRVYFLLVAAVMLLVASFLLYSSQVKNPEVVAEVTAQPQGSLAARVTVLTLPSGRVLPANYLVENNLVFIGVDGLWWREFRDPSPVSLLIKGQQLDGSGKVILDDPVYTTDVFSRLRPAVPWWLPDFLNGKLVVISLKLAHSGE